MSENDKGQELNNEDTADLSKVGLTTLTTQTTTALVESKHLNTYNVSNCIYLDSGSATSFSVGPSPSRKPDIETIPRYTKTVDLPDCIIIKRGDDKKEENQKEKTSKDDWYYEVTCSNCKSILVTRCVNTSEGGYGMTSMTYTFWCPCCEKQCTITERGIKGYDPMVLRYPATVGCTIQ